VRGFLSYLYSERRLLSKDLAPLVTGPPMFARSKPPKFLRKDEIKKLFGSLKYSTAAELRSAAIVHLAFLLGLRPCEISFLKLDDIDFGKGQVCLRRRKNNRPDRLPLPEAAIKAIAAYLVGGRAQSKHRTVFLTLQPPYRPMSAHLIGMCVGNCMQSAGLDTHAYWLRHTYAQNLLESGSSLYEVKEMLGHRSIESTRKYLYIHIELMRKVLFDETL
jgi:integrase/recombinase XerD